MPALATALALSCLLQSPAVGSPAADSSVATAVAVRTSQPVTIDGRADDPVWRTAPIISDFLEFAPTEGGRPR